MKTNRGRICWITSDCFVDCDFNPNILREILKQFDIYWIIILENKNSRYSNYDFSDLDKLEGLKIETIKHSYNEGHFLRCYTYFKIIRNIMSKKPDIIYLNCAPSPMLVLCFNLLPSSKKIIAAHQGTVHSGFKTPWKHIMMRNIYFYNTNRIIMFSKSQAKLMAKRYPKKKIEVIPLALKDFGESNVIKENNEIVFIAFGQLVPSKRIDLLIEAACDLYEEGYEDFKVEIYGCCNEWEKYKEKIKYPNIFKTDIRLIDNSEIPSIFTKAHFLIQPYSVVTQSGPMKIAFNYNLPVICSDLPGFSDEVNVGINGFVFKVNDRDALKKELKKAIQMVRNGEYEVLCKNMKLYTEDHYSDKSISKSYIEFFKKK